MCTEVKSRLEAQQLVIQQLEVSLREKERDCAERINAVREEEFQKLSLVSQSNSSLYFIIKIYPIFTVENCLTH